MILTHKAYSIIDCEPSKSILPVKHEMFARCLIIHKGNQTKAYLEVYKSCSIKSAPSKASRLVRNGNVFGRIYELLGGNSFLLERACKQIAKCLDAEKVIHLNGKTFSVPDNHTRLVAIKMAMKLFGDW